jgi:hypothetical protein
MFSGEDRRCVRGSGVLEVDGPFDDREVGVLDRHAADFQPGRFVGVTQRVLRARASSWRVERFGCHANSASVLPPNLNENGGSVVKGGRPAPSRNGKSASQISRPSCSLTLASAQSAWSQLIPSPASSICKNELARAVQLDTHRHTRHAFPHHSGLERLGAADQDREPHAAAPVASLFVAVHAGTTAVNTSPGPGSRTMICWTHGSTGRA